MQAFTAIVVAAGRGRRFGRPKQPVDLAGKPVLQWCLDVFRTVPAIAEIVVVTESEWLQDVTDAARGCTVVAGGPTRQASVYEGLKAAASRSGGVLVHDGARPFVDAGAVHAGMAPVRPGHAAVLALPVVDTIKVASAGAGIVQKTLDRAKLWAAQTPQFSMFADMLLAHEAGIREKIDATDDAMLLERAGVQVHIVPGSPENFKITLPSDLERAQQIARARS